MASSTLVILLIANGLVFVLAGAWLFRVGKNSQMDTINLLYSLTHDELSNPLQGALAALVNIENYHAESNTDIQDELKSLRSSLFRLIDVTRNLRALVLVEVPQSVQGPEHINLVAMTQSLVVELGKKAEEQGVTLTYVGADSPIYVRAQRSELNRILSNVVGNGIKFTQGNADAAVFVTLKDLTRVARIVVSDNGCGMSEEKLATIGLTPQRPSSHSTGTQGAGLGLYLITRIIKRYKGKLDISSTLNVGTTVTIELPKT